MIFKNEIESSLSMEAAVSLPLALVLFLLSLLSQTENNVYGTRLRRKLQANNSWSLLLPGLGPAMQT